MVLHYGLLEQARDCKDKDDSMERHYKGELD